MFAVDHAATALLIKRRFPSVSLTPMLLSVGDNDFRVPEGNAFSMYAALQRMNVPTKLLVWPDENHWILKPANSIQWHETVVGWLDRWLK